MTHGRRGTDSTSRPALSWCCVGAGGGPSPAGACTAVGRWGSTWLATHSAAGRWGSTWLATHSAAARDLASVAERNIWERLASVKSPSGMSSSSLCGAARLAATLAYASACSLPATLLWAETQRIVTSLPQERTRSQTSIAAMAKR